MRSAKIALGMALLVCLTLSVRQVHRPGLADFYVYDAAAKLVEEHQSSHLYDGFDTGSSFALKFVSPDTALGRAARQIGVDRVRLYIYPPILADLLVPLSFFSARTAGQLWLLFNAIAILSSTFLMIRVLSVRLRSVGALAVLLGFITMFSTISSLMWGQITLLLLLMWMFGIYAYQRGWRKASAFVLAIATLVKLTPVVVVVPFLIWKDWKWLRTYGASIVVLILVMCLANKPSLLEDYCFHVMPSISAGGAPDFENKSLLSATQLLYVAVKGGSIRPVTISIPQLVVDAGKLISLLIVLLASSLLLRSGPAMRLWDRLLVISLFALLSACIAPISWKHAYVVVFLSLSMLWAEELKRPATHFSLVFMVLCSIELGTFVFDSVAMKITSGIVLSLLSFLGPVTGLALVFVRLNRMRAEVLVV